MTQNVVTYATVIDAPNPELKLKPGMTATVTVEVARRENVTRIPNAALRFRPTPTVFAALGQPVPPELQAGRRAGGGGESGADSEGLPGLMDRHPARRNPAVRAAGAAAASARAAETAAAASAAAQERIRNGGSACWNGCSRCRRKSARRSSRACGSGAPPGAARAGPGAAREGHGAGRTHRTVPTCRRSSVAPAR